MVHAPAVGGSSSFSAAAAPIRNSNHFGNGDQSNGVQQTRMGRMGTVVAAPPPTSNGVATPAMKPLSAMKAAELDMTTVERRGQPTMARETHKPNRMFGLQEAPTFRPTEEEFRNPTEYIRKITPEGKRYGIVKIIPPDEWNPELAIDTEVCTTLCATCLPRDHFELVAIFNFPCDNG
jgi:[histone H3]-trimethyl-L-lysine4 demethylase